MKRVTLVLLLLSGFAFAASGVMNSHKEAAKGLYELMSPKETFIKTFMVMFKPQLAKMEAMGVEKQKIKRIEQAGLEFTKKIAEDPELEKRMVDLYAQTFSEKELRELNRFYKTPTGKKALEKMPELFQKGAQIGQQLAMKHQVEFQKKMEAILTEGASQ